MVGAKELVISGTLKSVSDNKSNALRNRNSHSSATGYLTLACTQTELKISTVGN